MGERWSSRQELSNIEVDIPATPAIMATTHSAEHTQGIPR